MATATFELEQFQQGYIIAWEILTQCQNTVKVTITEGKETIAAVEKTNRSTNLQVIGQNYAVLKSQDIIKLTITVNESKLLKPCINSGAITDQKARKVGYTYNFCIEDENDDDYNDVYVNIVGWENKG